ncbi:MAG TPA: ribulose-phosphate 3-epimerase [Armatimonadetes bacterium]|nr:ribulose-phosphate 3-epimerase [Armatimonadota bacterium]
MCADWRNLECEMRQLEEAGIDGFHFDIMDGHFVPNLTMGFDVVRALRPVTKLPFDIHLMVEEPERYIERFATIGVQSISVHVESTAHVQRALQQVKDAGIAPIAALNPATPLEALDYLWDDIWAVLIMTVNPGFAGQRAVPAAVNKINDVHKRIVRSARLVLIQVDGNVSFELAPQMVKNGARILIGGSSSIFVKGMTPSDALRKLRQVLTAVER